MGRNVDTIVSVAEIIKYRVKGLHQVNKIGTQVFEDVFEPLEEGLDTLKFKRTVSFFTITLSTVEPLEKGYGYQEPIDESLVDENEPLPRAPQREGAGETPAGNGGERRGGERRPREDNGERKFRGGSRGGRGGIRPPRQPREGGADIMRGDEGRLPRGGPRRGGYGDRPDFASRGGRPPFGGESSRPQYDRPPRTQYNQPRPEGNGAPRRGGPYRGGPPRGGYTRGGLAPQ
ncbi:hypothetical protein FGO68_gene6301 [Halteria grandinella]|uniref:Uncharacterized protein n=1 Tax=Halteria grandinella TaxID=5974 RepID=A0A8J8NSD8_HALGN|nr:hypothetical protein FGO68_gene6301 [Halteria grandinella]